MRPSWWPTQTVARNSTRLTLRALGLRPDGETAAQAQDRLVTVSSVEAARLFR